MICLICPSQSIKNEERDSALDERETLQQETHNIKTLLEFHLGKFGMLFIKHSLCLSNKITPIIYDF